MFGIKILSNREFVALREEMTLYQRQLEDIGWINVSMDASQQNNQLFGEGFKKMLRTCKTYYYRNPLAGHWVDLTTAFVFGEGVSTPKSKDENVQEIINKFWDDPDNKLTLTSFPAQQLISNKLQYEGNLFFVLYDDDEANVRVRILNTEEIADIIKDNEDRMRSMFYKVAVRDNKFNFVSDTYQGLSLNKFVYYPDISNANILDFNIPTDKLPEQGVVIYHVKINCDINDKFGVPQLYRGIDWIKAHKDMAGDLATLIKALSTLAWKKKVKGTPAQVATLRAAMHAKTDFTNIGPAAGSTQYENEGIDTQPINTPTGGAAIGEKGLKQMQLMVCAASGLFYHYFGDPSTGNLATAYSMELPMVKKFENFQTLWQAVYNDILQHVINKKIESGLLSGSSVLNEKTRRMEYKTDIDRTIDIDFPPILDKDPKAVAESLEIAKRAGLISEDSAARIFLLANNINNVEQEIEVLKKEKKDKEAKAQEIAAGMPGAGMPGAAAPGAIPPGDQPKEKKTTDQPVKEAIDAIERDPLLKMTKKSNYVLQRMNGYRKALAGHYFSFRKAVRSSIKTAGDEKQVVGIVENLDEHIAALKKGMLDSAKTYFPIAVDIGKKYIQSHLKNPKAIMDSLYEANNRDSGFLKDKLSWNEKYITESLLPDIEKKIMTAVVLPYSAADDFSKAINEAVDVFEPRIEQYVGAFWRVEEGAVKEAGKGTGVMVNFVGADDESTCDGCKEAMSKNPYPIDEAPEPGEHECDGKCRHALQILE